MSSIISNFKEENKDVFTSNNDNQPKTTNLPILITGYEGNFFVGTRIDTKQEVRVMLRDVPQKGDKPRIELKDFSDPKNFKYYVEPNNPNSIILFDNAYQEDDGTWNARWANILSKTKKESQVLVMNASMQLVKTADSKFFVVNTVKNKQVINNDSELYNAMIAGLTQKMPKSNPFVVVSFRDSTGAVLNQAFYARKEKNAEGVKVCLDPNQYMQEMWSDEKIQKLLSLITNPEVTVTLYSIVGINFGADTNTKMIGNKYEIEKAAREYLDIDDTNNTSTALYKKTVLAMRKRDDGSSFLISAKAIDNNVKGVPLEEL